MRRYPAYSVWDKLNDVMWIGLFGFAPVPAVLSRMRNRVVFVIEILIVLGFALTDGGVLLSAPFLAGSLYLSIKATERDPTSTSGDGPNG